MKNAKQVFWADINSSFGVWHFPNTTFRHQKSCFDVSYTSNSYGACDIERSRASDRSRIAVIGDSFVEGYGVSHETRFSNILETKTGIPHLNFGTSGSFGAIQESLLYSDLVNDFDHDAVLIGLLPDNDFDDDNRSSSDRYVPYWSGAYPTYELKYTLDDVAKSSFAPEQMNFNTWKVVQRNYTHIANVADYVSAIWEYRKKVAHSNEEDYVSEKSRFVRFSNEEFNRLIYSYEQIIKAAGNKKIIIFSIPRVYDLEYFLLNKKSPLGERITQWANQFPTVQFIDLLPLMSNHLEKNDLESFTLFHTCDGHWNASGHALAAALLLQHISEYQ